MTNKLRKYRDSFKARLDEKNFIDLERRQPGLVNDIRGMVQEGVSPAQIAFEMMVDYPHMWPEAQAVKAAARHLEREL